MPSDGGKEISGMLKNSGHGAVPKLCLPYDNDITSTHLLIDDIKLI